MSSPWIQHVKQFQNAHGCSYKDAMSLSRPSYQSVSGGKFSVSKLAKKGKRVLKKTNKFYDANSGILDSMVGDEAAKAMHTARGYSENVDQMSGGKFNVKKVFKKGKKGLKKASSVYDNNQDLIGAMAGAENAAVLSKARAYAQQADELTGGRFNLHHAMRKAGHTIGRAKAVARIAAPVLSVVAPEIGLPLAAGLAATGGSYMTHGGSFQTGGGFCPHCGQGKIPLKPKGYSDRNR